MPETKKTKYDTNPLDPDYVRKTDDLRDQRSGGEDTKEAEGATREVNPSIENARRNIYSEAPTRRYDSPPLDGSYPSVFVPPGPSKPTPYQPANPYVAPQAYQKPPGESVAGIGLPERWATMLAYAPFFIGMVASLVELFLVPRKEVRVRFHAAQGLALHLAILAVQTFFGIVGAIADSSLGGSLFSLAAVIFLIVSMVRVWKGEPHQIAPLYEPAKWLNERIEPRNKG